MYRNYQDYGWFIRPRIVLGPWFCNDIPCLEVTSSKLGSYHQHMKKHALTCKFMGFHPNESALMGWINHKWNPRGGTKLKPGSKGFVTTIFSNLEDQERVVGQGPYFLNNARLFIRIILAPIKKNFQIFKFGFIFTPSLVIIGMKKPLYAQETRWENILKYRRKPSKVTTSCLLACVNMNIS